MSVIFERISVCHRVLKSEISVSFGQKYIYLLIFLVDLYSEIINNLKDNLSWFSKTLGRHFIIGKVYCLAPKTSSSANFEKKADFIRPIYFPVRRKNNNLSSYHQLANQIQGPGVFSDM